MLHDGCLRGRQLLKQVGDDGGTAVVGVNEAERVQGASLAIAGVVGGGRRARGRRR